jgi:hypothetical protein
LGESRLRQRWLRQAGDSAGDFVLFGKWMAHHGYVTDMLADVQVSDKGMSIESQAAGHKPDVVSAEKVVTAACADSVAEAMMVGESLASRPITRYWI